MTTYPITITRASIVDAGAECEGLDVFDEIAPGGQIIIADLDAHVALLRGPLANYEEWAVMNGQAPPIVVVSGDFGTAVAGYRGTAVAGHQGIATVGHYGAAIAGHHGIATAGRGGTGTAGHYGTATAGHYGTATAGNYGTAITGRGGGATAGNGGTAAAGRYGIIQVFWCDGPRARLLVGYIGEDGLEPDVPYRVTVTDGAARFVRADGAVGAAIDADAAEASLSAD